MFRTLDQDILRILPKGIFRALHQDIFVPTKSFALARATAGGVVSPVGVKMA